MWVSLTTPYIVVEQGKFRFNNARSSFFQGFFFFFSLSCLARRAKSIDQRQTNRRIQSECSEKKRPKQKQKKRKTIHAIRRDRAPVSRKLYPPSNKSFCLDTFIIPIETKLLSILLRIKRVRPARGFVNRIKVRQAGRRFAADTRRKSFPAFFPPFSFLLSFSLTRSILHAVPRHYNFGNGRTHLPPFSCVGPEEGFPQYGHVRKKGETTDNRLPLPRK